MNKYLKLISCNLNLTECMCGIIVIANSCNLNLKECACGIIEITNLKVMRFRE